MSSRKIFCVEQRDAGLVISSLPELQEYRGECVESCDLLLLASGFEERILTVPEILRDQGVRAGRILMGQYQTNKPDNDARLEELLPILSAISSDIAYVDAEDPSALLDQVRQTLRDRQQARVHADVSGASVPYILSLVGVLSQLRGIKLSVTFWYCEAKAYAHPKDIDAVPSAWSETDLPESGVADVWAHPMFRGHHHEQAGTFVIAFPSLYTARLARCLSYCDATESLDTSNVLWVFPITEREGHTWRRDKINEAVECLRGGASGGGKAIGIPAEYSRQIDIHDYRGALRTVIEAADEHEGNNLFLIQFGSKLQSLGTALGLAARTEIAAVYARPEKFNAARYSAGSGVVWNVSFPNLATTIEAVRQIGALELIAESGRQ